MEGLAWLCPAATCAFYPNAYRWCFGKYTAKCYWVFLRVDSGHATALDRLGFAVCHQMTERTWYVSFLTRMLVALWRGGQFLGPPPSMLRNQHTRSSCWLCWCSQKGSSIDTVIGCFLYSCGCEIPNWILARIWNCIYMLVRGCRICDHCVEVAHCWPSILSWMIWSGLCRSIGVCRVYSFVQNSWKRISVTCWNPLQQQASDCHLDLGYLFRWAFLVTEANSNTCYLVVNSTHIGKSNRYESLFA